MAFTPKKKAHYIFTTSDHSVCSLLIKTYNNNSPIYEGTNGCEEKLEPITIF